jgi:hypothetical protein
MERNIRHGGRENYFDVRMLTNETDYFHDNVYKQNASFSFRLTLTLQCLMFWKRKVAYSC